MIRLPVSNNHSIDRRILFFVKQAVDVYEDNDKVGRGDQVNNDIILLPQLIA